MWGIKCNMGRIDRILRFLVGSALIYFSLIDDTLIHNNVIRYMLLTLAIGNVLSSIIAFCPMYIFAGISTQKRSARHTT